MVPVIKLERLVLAGVDFVMSIFRYRMLNRKLHCVIKQLLIFNVNVYHSLLRYFTKLDWQIYATKWVARQPRSQSVRFKVNID